MLRSKDSSLSESKKVAHDRAYNKNENKPHAEWTGRRNESERGERWRRHGYSALVESHVLENKTKKKIQSYHADFFREFGFDFLLRQISFGLQPVRPANTTSSYGSRR